MSPLFDWRSTAIASKLLATRTKSFHGALLCNSLSLSISLLYLNLPFPIFCWNQIFIAFSIHYIFFRRVVIDSKLRELWLGFFVFLAWIADFLILLNYLSSSWSCFFAHFCNHWSSVVWVNWIFFFVYGFLGVEKFIMGNDVDEVRHCSWVPYFHPQYFNQLSYLVSTEFCSM